MELRYKAKEEEEEEADNLAVTLDFSWHSGESHEWRMAYGVWRMAILDSRFASSTRCSLPDRQPNLPVRTSPSLFAYLCLSSIVCMQLPTSPFAPQEPAARTGTQLANRRLAIGVIKVDQLASGSLPLFELLHLSLSLIATSVRWLCSRRIYVLVALHFPTRKSANSVK